MLISTLSQRHRPSMQAFLAAQNADSPTYRYRLDESSGTSMVDEIAANNGTLSGSGYTLAVDGPWPGSKAIEMNGNSAISSFASAIYDVDADYTFEALVYLTSVTSRMGLTGTRLSNGFQGGAYRFNANNDGESDSYITGQSSIAQNASNWMSLNTWYHVALSHDFWTANSFIMVDGLAGSSGNMGNGTTGTTGIIGEEKGTSVSSNGWIGRIAMFTCYSTPLSAARLQAHARAGGFL